MLAEIRRSAFAVVDLTGHRPNVYFEAGFALGLDKKVIFTCAKSDVDDGHFDLRQYNTLDWESEDDLAVRLENRVRAVIGPPRTDS